MSPYYELSIFLLYISVYNLLHTHTFAPYLPLPESHSSLIKRLKKDDILQKPLHSSFIQSLGRDQAPCLTFFFYDSSFRFFSLSGVACFVCFACFACSLALLGISNCVRRRTATFKHVRRRVAASACFRRRAATFEFEIVVTMCVWIAKSFSEFVKSKLVLKGGLSEWQTQ